MSFFTLHNNKNNRLILFFKARNSELQLKKSSNKHAEQNLLAAKIDDKLQSYKEKSSQKMAIILQK